MGGFGRCADDAGSAADADHHQCGDDQPDDAEGNVQDTEDTDMSVHLTFVVFDVIPWWSVLLAAAVAVIAYVTVGRDHSSPSVREVAWIAAVSASTQTISPEVRLSLMRIASAMRA